MRITWILLLLVFLVGCQTDPFETTLVGSRDGLTSRTNSTPSLLPDFGSRGSMLGPFLVVVFSQDKTMVGLLEPTGDRVVYYRVEDLRVKPGEDLVLQDRIWLSPVNFDRKEFYLVTFDKGAD